MGKKMKANLQLREAVIGFVYRTEKFVKNYDADTDVHQLQERIAKLDEKWSEFESVQGDIEELEEDENNMAAHEQFRADFEELFFKVKAGLRSKLPFSPPSPTATSSIRDRNVGACTGIRLAKISLPEFSGEYDKWLPFFDTFRSLIHENTDLNQIQKFHHLRASLRGEALKVVDSFQMSEASYGVAWSALVKRYSNKYLQKKRHVNAMLQYPKVKKRSANGIHELIECFDRHTKILDQLGEITTDWGAMLMQLLVSKLDDESLKDWEERAVKKDDPVFADVMEFLEGQTRILDAVAVDRRSENLPSHFSTANSSFKKSGSKFSVHATTDTPSMQCLQCNGRHYLTSCPAFGQMSLEKRFQVVNSKKLCSNCLKQGHLNRDCTSRFRCRTCSKKHHSLLHPGIDAAAFTPTVNPTTQVPSSNRQQTSPSTHVVSTDDSLQTVQSSVATIFASNVATEHREYHVFLSTVLVTVKDCNGRSHLARALLDSGSQANLISDRLCQILKLPRKGVSVPISGIGSSTFRVSHSVSTTISSRISDYSVPMEFFVMKKVTEDQPSATIPIGDWNLPTDIELADPGFNKRGAIDLLLGLEYFYEFLLLNGGRVQIQRIGNGRPLFVNTVFGWVAAGKVNLGRMNPVPVCHVAVDNSLEQKIERFWTIEEIQDVPRLTQEEIYCENHYKVTFSRDTEGRYVVRLPKRLGFEKMIGDSREMAVRRLIQLERRFKRDEDLHKRYSDSIRDYLINGHMLLVEDVEERSEHRLVCYLPHHPVIKETSTTTKIRPVFDGSAKTTSNYSLNNALMTGPVIQDQLIDLILRFRKHKVALVADIEKMYLQVKVHSDDCPLQRILWRFSPSDPIKTYELQRVTFGLAPSSFLATRSLQQLAEDEGDAFPRAKAALVDDFYIDDYIGGADSVEEAVLLRQELEQLLPKGGFRLRKWNSSTEGVLEGVSAEDLGTQTTLVLDKEEQVKALGVIWKPGPDVLGIDVSTSSIIGCWTRRQVYSVIARLFDPLGLIGPVITWAKVRMQQLWVAFQDWDEPLSQELTERWAQFYEQLPLLSNVKVNRFAFCSQPYLVQFHIFSDASEAAYGACIYARTISQTGLIKVELLSSKSRPAPLKRVSIARLELCGALLAAKLYQKVRHALKMDDTEAWFWSDSTVVLCWLRSPSYVWPTYVANRVSQIQEWTKGHRWNHVKGTENPADLVSLGVTPKDFVDLQNWFHGPAWLSLLDQHWNNPKRYDDPPEDQLERKRIILTALTHMEPHPLIDRISSYWKLLRVTALCLRFARKCQRRHNEIPDISHISVAELQVAKQVLVRQVQQEAFATELKELSNHRVVPVRSPLKLLNPFLDQQGVLRVGGRLEAANESFPVRQPIIIPSKHSFSRLVAVAYHQLSLHAGPRMTLAQVRQEYWPLNGMSLASYTYRNCIRCFRSNPVPVTQPPGQFPRSRTLPARPFATTGVDFCGPIYLKPVHRKAAAQKAYIAVFVCFCTKAVHLELVGDLSTAKFIAALCRFVGKRGVPAEIQSDNGLNFKGASNELRALYDLLNDSSSATTISNEAAQNGIVWKFIPPKAPNFGGLWEAAVKSAKSSLVKLLGQRRLSFEDMTTVLGQVEAVMNSRPLTPLSEVPDELDVLTPGHFLTGSSLLAIPDPDYTGVPTNRLEHYQQLQQLIQQHWKRWRREYISQLHNVNQRAFPPIKLKVGQMVVLKEDDKAPYSWPLGRITEVHPGPDGVVRVVTLRTSQGIYKRPASRVCLLPFEKDSRGQPSTSCLLQSTSGTPRDVTSPTHNYEAQGHNK
ncbi:uncharacterized protein LOC129766719 [Toxorhynchites rutilus septentrionalis]|uniref:uncharacterized protein LOC129766719 n=1 Tax=Toxorhynchites rutilus septentrionalis TaxID=329112 RepID=UPI00247916E6|nr:uncharacterized protein LOC129766719 [Toxorhynchites rutilus septentrionalis]